MADQRLRACIQRVDEAEMQVSKVLSETREELSKALQEILSGVRVSLKEAPGDNIQPQTTQVKETLGDVSSQISITQESKTSESYAADPTSSRIVEGSQTFVGISSMAVEVDLPVEADSTTFSSQETIKSIRRGDMSGVLDHLASREPKLTAIDAEKEKDLEGIAEETATRLGISGDDVMHAYRCFSRTDVDHSGKVSTSELRRLLQELTGEDIDQKSVHRILQKYDKDGDGELDFEEFLYCFCYTPAKKVEHLKAAIFQKEDKLDSKFRIRMVGVAATDLRKYLRKEIGEELAFLQIPIIFLLFFFFVLAVSFHRSTYMISSVERSVEFDIVENANFAFVGTAPFENGRMGHKGLHDVNSFADFWSWLDLGLAPLFFPSGWGLSEVRSNIAARCQAPLEAMASAGIKGESTANTPYYGGVNASYAAGTGDLGPNLCNMEAATAFPQAVFGDSLNAFADTTKTPYLYFSEIIAGVRIRQEQLPEVECIYPSLRNHAYSTPCIKINDNAWLEPHVQDVMMINDDLVDRPGGRTVYLRSGMGLTDVRSEIRSLENQRWLNQRTGKIEITLGLYNNQIDAFVAVYINLFITRAGKIHKIIKPVAWFMDAYSNPWSYVVDTIFTILVLKLFLEEVREIFRSIREGGVKAGLKVYFYDFKNIVDWASLSYSALVFGMWITWCLKLKDMSDILLTANTSLKGSWDSSDANDIYTASNLAFWEEIDEIAKYDQWVTFVFAFYPILIALRFFSAFSSQPRLGLVTATLAAASNDLIHFAVVLGVTLMAFCASAEIFFGKEVAGFENFGRSFVSILRGALGQLEYEDLTGAGRIPANAWWSIFMVLVNCVMLNMVLAIIMDVYSSVKGSMGSDLESFPTLWSQTDEIFRRWRKKRAGLRLSLDQILHALEEHESLHMYEYQGTVTHTTIQSSKLISVSMFLSAVPGLGKDQAERLLGNAIIYFDGRAKAEAKMEDCMSGLRGVDLKVQQVQTVTEVMEGINGLTEEMSNAVDQCRRSLEASKRLARISTEDANSGQSSRIVRLIV